MNVQKEFAKFRAKLTEEEFKAYMSVREKI